MSDDPTDLATLNARALQMLSRLPGQDQVPFISSPLKHTLTLCTHPHTHLQLIFALGTQQHWHRAGVVE